MSSVKGVFKLHKIKLPGENPKYKILSISDIIDQEIEKLVTKSADIFGHEDVSQQDCRKALYHFNWNYDRMAEKYYDANSFSDFLNGNKIDLAVPLTIQTLVDSFILAKSLYTWCPNKDNGCNKVVKIDTSDVQDITCECGVEYCFKCLATPHSPFPCVLLQEWVVQRDEFKLILRENDLICPHCSHTYKDDIGGRSDLFHCVSCNNISYKRENKLTRRHYLDYFYYKRANHNLKQIEAKKNALIGKGNVEFLATVFKVTKNLLQQDLALHAFSFYLDKEYLGNNPATENHVHMYDFRRKQLKQLFNQLLEWIDERMYITDASIDKEAKDKALKTLFLIQQNFGSLFKFIKATRGWIFKLPEIQQAYLTDENDGIGMEKSDDIYDEYYDDTEEEDGESHDDVCDQFKNL